MAEWALALTNRAQTIRRPPAVGWCISTNRTSSGRQAGVDSQRPCRENFMLRFKDTQNPETGRRRKPRTVWQVIVFGSDCHRECLPPYHQKELNGCYCSFLHAVAGWSISAHFPQLINVKKRRSPFPKVLTNI